MPAEKMYTEAEMEDVISTFQELQAMLVRALSDERLLAFQEYKLQQAIITDLRLRFQETLRPKPNPHGSHTCPMCHAEHGILDGAAFDKAAREFMGTAAAQEPVAAKPWYPFTVFDENDVMLVSGVWAQDDHAAVIQIRMTAQFQGHERAHHAVQMT